MRRARGSAAAVLASTVLASAATPATAWAHVKWFEDPARYPLRADLILSERTAIWLGASAAALGLLYLVQRLAGSPHWPRLAVLHQMAIGAPTLLAMHAAVGLVQAAVGPTLFAPNLPLARDALGLTLAALQILIAFTFITGLADVAGAVALLGLVAIGFLLFPPFDVLEQLHWVGIGVTLLVIGRFAVVASQARPWWQRRTPAWSARAVAALRILTGLAIVGPALSEKLWNPELGRAFLEHRPQFNVVQSSLGVDWFSHDLLVLVAGTVEGAIGVLLISGVLTRVVVLGMWLPFNLGLPFLPPQELLGHLPIFGIMYLLLVYGAGIAPGESLDRPTPPGAPVLEVRERVPARD